MTMQYKRQEILKDQNTTAEKPSKYDQLKDLMNMCIEFLKCVEMWKHV